MKRSDIYYKVTLFYRNGHWSSALGASLAMWGEHNPYLLSYRQGCRTTAPKGTKIFIFDTLDNAKRFTENESNGVEFQYYIWKCRAEDVEPCSEISFDTTAYSIECFWTNHPDRDVIKPPPGTFMASAVTLLEPVAIYKEGKELKCNV